MTPTQLAEALKAGRKLTVIDVREPWEFETAHIEGAKLIPLGDLPTRYLELEPDDEYVTLCHHGVRSMHAAMFLANQGFEKLHNLKGGIDAWSNEVDASVPRY
jgi:rhodanese-related sulfurtransferase